jgi:hypothetical protein
VSLCIALAVGALGAAPSLAAPRARTAEASHAGWPAITGMLLMNKRDQSRPLDGRPGHDPFDGADPSYSCNGAQRNTSCGGGTDFGGGDSGGQSCTPDSGGIPWLLSALGLSGADPCAHASQAASPTTVPAAIGHNELLGGHGNDTIHAGPAGDVIWGDFHPSGQPTTQVDRLYGGPGNDWIYASHGTNDIWTGAGADHVMLVYGTGTVHCNGPGRKTLVMRALAAHRHYRLVGCAGARIVPYAA